jgi:hypothetical protein
VAILSNLFCGDDSVDDTSIPDLGVTIGSIPTDLPDLGAGSIPTALPDVDATLSLDGGTVGAADVAADVSLGAGGDDVDASASIDLGTGAAGTAAVDAEVAHVLHRVQWRREQHRVSGGERGAGRGPGEV